MPETSIRVGQRYKDFTPKDLMMAKERVARRETVGVDQLTWSKTLDKERIGVMQKLIKRGIKKARPVLAVAQMRQGKVDFKLLTEDDDSMAASVSALNKGQVELVVVYGQPGFNIKQANKWDLVRLGEMGAVMKRKEVIPVSRIYIEKKLYDWIDFEKKDTLKEEITFDGQNSPITVGALADRKKMSITYEPTDGIHRSDGFKERKKKECDAIVFYGWTKPDIVEQRANSLNSNRSTMVIRVADITKMMYAETDFPRTTKLKLSQAWSLGMNQTSGAKHKLSRAKADEIAGWVRRTSDILRGASNLGPMAIFNIIKSAENSYPEILRQVGYGKGGGREGSGVLSQAKFSALANILEKDLDRQRLVVAINREHNLTAPEIVRLSEAVKKIGMDKNQLLKRLMEDPMGVVEAREKKQTASEYAASSTVVFDASVKSKGGSSEPRKLNFVDVDSKNPARTVKKTEKQELKELDILEAADMEANQILETPTLDTTEKAIWVMMLLQGYTDQEIAARLSLTIDNVWKFFQSGLVKINVYNREQRIFAESKSLKPGRNS